MDSLSKKPIKIINCLQYCESKSHNSQKMCDFDEYKILFNKCVTRCSDMSFNEYKHSNNLK